MGDRPADKSERFRDLYLSSNGSIVDVHAGDKLFIETRIFRSAEPSAENINLIVKSSIKKMTSNQVTISDVELLVSFEDPIKQSIFKEIDQSKFQSQFRLKNIKLLKGGNWGIVPNKVKSGLSGIIHQGDLYVALGFPVQDGQDETAIDSGDEHSGTEALFAILL